MIVGGGYAGVSAAVRLAGHRNLDVTLVNPSPRFVQRVRLHQVAAGESIAEPLLTDILGPNVTTVIGRVVGADLDAGKVTVAAGDSAGELRFDRLVLATGSRVDTSTVPGTAEHVHQVADLDGARRLAAAWRALSPGAAVTVVGGGLTGIETAAELAAARADVEIRLVTSGPLGDWFSTAAATALRRGLTRAGVTVTDHTRVTGVEPGRLTLDGEQVRSDLTVWCGGLSVSRLARDMGLAVDDRGVVLTDDRLRSLSHPQVLAIGDAGRPPACRGATYSMTCQTAMPVGAHAAHVVAAEAVGRSPRPVVYGYLHRHVSLGRRDGVVQFVSWADRPVDRILTGRSAARYKESITASLVPAMRAGRRFSRLPGAWRLPA